MRYLVVHLFRAVKHIHHDPEGSPQVFSCLSLASPSWSGRGSTHDQMKGLGQCDVASIGEGRDDKASRVAKVLVGVAELSITDVGKTVPLCVVPSA